MDHKGNYQMKVMGQNISYLTVETNAHLNLLFIEVDGKTVELDWEQAVTLVKDLRVFISKLEKPVKREGGNHNG
tara:strand:- start:608 stop:829 length:222 start_codon:yes stop_codon:yes gene_type:complete